MEWNVADLFRSARVGNLFSFSVNLIYWLPLQRFYFTNAIKYKQTTKFYLYFIQIQLLDASADPRFLRWEGKTSRNLALAFFVVKKEYTETYTRGFCWSSLATLQRKNI
jgi:hypothetical protein